MTSTGSFQFPIRFIHIPELVCTETHLRWLKIEPSTLLAPASYSYKSICSYKESSLSFISLNYFFLFRSSLLLLFTLPKESPIFAQLILIHFLPYQEWLQHNSNVLPHHMTQCK